MLNDKGLVEVFYIIPGSAAEEAGFKKGDIVKTINGIDAASYPNLVKLRELFYAPIGTTYRIKINRGDKLLNIKLELEELL